MHPFALSPAGDLLYLGTENGTLRMCSIADHSSPLIEIRAHDSKITNIKLSPDNRSSEFIRRLENWASNRFRQNRQSRPRDIAQPSGRGQMFPSKISRVSYFSRCW